MAQLREDRVDLPRVTIEPSSKRRGILIDRRRRNPSTARIGVVRSAELKRRKHRAVPPGDAVEVAAENRSSHNEMMVPPRVIRSNDCTLPGRLECSAEIGQRKRRDV